MLISLICRFKYLPNHDDKITVKALLSGHLQDLPKVGVGGALYRGCPLNRSFKNCAMFVND